METAVAEWYLIGEADYCTIGCERSTFSTTAIKRTDCIYLPYYLAENCVTSSMNSTRAKPNTEFVLDSLWKEITSGLLEDPGGTNMGVSYFIAALRKEKKGITTSMTAQTHPDVVSNIWTQHDQVIH